MKDTDHIAEGTSEHDNYINNRMAELKGILRKLFENFIKFLFAANSGGIIAVATFIKLNGTIFNLFPKIAITFFAIGIFTASLLLLRMSIRIYKIDKAWHLNTNLWHKDEINWKELNDRDHALTQSDQLEFSLMLIGFGAFIIGLITIILGIWCP
ncbi:MAG: hypothetical protein OEL79_09500 [Chromatiales bacterium]|nr:hypothetical protein [Chromatiales bacterium]